MQRLHRSCGCWRRPQLRIATGHIQWENRLASISTGSKTSRSWAVRSMPSSLERDVTHWIQCSPSARGEFMDDVAAVWPDLSYVAWHETASTLQLWTQIVGKVRLTLTPWLNHGWQVPLYVTGRGLSTSPIPVGN